MPEPEQLKRGKIFQKIVQKDFKNHTINGEACKEKMISFEGQKDIKQKIGRMDILISELGDFVTILEIKATDWDKIKQKNIKKNLYRHQKQLFKYVEKFTDVDKLDVCLGIIYPKPPRKKGLRQFIENYLEENYCVPAYWYSEIKSKS